MEEVDEAFASAASHYLKRGKPFSYAAKLDLYGLFKQATVGDVVGPQPRDLFNSWKVSRTTLTKFTKEYDDSQCL